MLEKPSCLLFHKLCNHVTEDSANSVETLVGSADVVQTVIIQQDLLNYEDGHSLAELRSGLHDAEAEGDDLGGQEKVDDFGRIILDKGTNDAEAGQSQVLERPRLRCCVEEGIEVEGDVS